MIHMCKYLYMYIYIFICMYICIYTFTYVYIPEVQQSSNAQSPLECFCNQSIQKGRGEGFLRFSFFVCQSNRLGTPVNLSVYPFLYTFFFFTHGAGHHQLVSAWVKPLCLPRAWLSKNWKLCIAISWRSTRVRHANVHRARVKLCVNECRKCEIDLKFVFQDLTCSNFQWLFFDLWGRSGGFVGT